MTDIDVSITYVSYHTYLTQNVAAARLGMISEAVKHRRAKVKRLGRDVWQRAEAKAPRWRGISLSARSIQLADTSGSFVGIPGSGE